MLLLLSKNEAVDIAADEHTFAEAAPLAVANIQVQGMSLHRAEGAVRKNAPSFEQ
jgi:hypothetical protein